MLAGIGAKGTLLLEQSKIPTVLGSKATDMELLNANWHQLHLQQGL
jgi:hypothetical protein